MLSILENRCAASLNGIIPEFCVAMADSYSMHATSRDKRRGSYEKTFALLMWIIIADMIKRENNFARKCARRRKCRSLHGKLHDFDISRCQE